MALETARTKQISLARMRYYAHGKRFIVMLFKIVVVVAVVFAYRTGLCTPSVEESYVALVFPSLLDFDTIINHFSKSKNRNHKRFHFSDKTNENIIN